MRPPFNSFRPQSHPHQQNNGYSNHHHHQQQQQHNGFHHQNNNNQVNSNQFGMMNQQMMNNPMMGHHMNNPIMPMPNLQIHPQFFNNMPQQFGFPNHLLPSLLGNLQFAVANNNLMGPPLLQPNLFRPPLDPSFIPNCYPPAPNINQNHQLQRPPRPQGQSNGNHNIRNNLTKHHNFNGPGQGFHKSQTHQANNGKKKFKKDQMSKGSCSKMATGVDGSDVGNIAPKKKRSYDLIYTKKEIKQWHDARRKNHPYAKMIRNDNKKNSKWKKKLRCQELKKVLAKQAELGVEVAEIPSKYFSEGKGKRGDGDSFNKKPRFEDENSSEESSVITRKPTLLEKLLTPEIKREKSQLLQVFRCMVMNSFFKEFPEKPLDLPLVMVEETGCEHDREDSENETLSDDDEDDGDSDLDSNGDDNHCDEAAE